MRKVLVRKTTVREGQLEKGKISGPCPICGFLHEARHCKEARELCAESPYPEHQKLKAISHLSQAQGEFLDWLQEQGIVLARWHGNELWMENTPFPKLLAEFHGIDQRKIEAEKRAMLDECRKANEKGKR